MNSALGLRVLLFTLLVPGAITVYVPYRLLGTADVPALPAASVLTGAGAGLLLLAGLAGYARCAWDFAVQSQATPAPYETPRRLVVTGLYRWTRNPMFLSILLILAGEALLFRSTVLLTYAAVMALAFQALVVLYEEPRLRRQFGAAYADYCRSVRRWWPSLCP